MLELKIFLFAQTLRQAQLVRSRNFYYPEWEYYDA